MTETSTHPNNTDTPVTSRWFTAAWLLGVVPLVAGLIVFGAWLVWRADWLMAAGGIVIMAGAACVAVGLCCLAIYVASVWSKRRTVRAVIVVLFYLACFASAGVVAWSANLLYTRHTATVTNLGKVTLDDVRIEGGGVQVALGTLEPGTSAEASFWVERDGRLDLYANRDGRPVHVVINGYVTHSLQGQHYDITIDATGKVRLRSGEAEPVP